jgi:hypothetical protein
MAAVVVVVFAIYVWTGVPDNTGAFAALADGFLHGHLYIDRDMPWLELVPVAPGSHQWYVPLPPVPAVLLVPFVAVLGQSFDVGMVVAFGGALSVVLLWTLLAEMGVPARVQPWLAVAFGLSSALWWVAGTAGTHHEAQVAGVVFALAALNLAVRDRWPLLAGLFLGLAAGSRLPVGLTLPIYAAFFGGLALFRGEDDGARRLHVRLARPRREAVVRVGWLLVGLALVAVPVALYNLARFGSPFDFGYTRIPSSFGMILDEPWYTHGLNSIEYIPRNLHAMFIRGFDYVDAFPWFRPNWTGMSLLLTTPILLWLAKARAWTTLVVVGWLAAVLGILPDVTHGGVGWAQFGYRRILDVAPVLFLMLGWVFRRGMSLEAKAAIVIGVAVNAYGIWAITVLDFVSF